MKLLLKRKVLDIVKILKKAGKYRLALCIEQNWDKTALEYSKQLNFWRPKKSMEKELLRAFDKELTRLGTRGILKLDILNSIKKRRVLQTAPHLGATESPRMLCINWLGSLAVEEKSTSTQGGDFYVVGMFSGIPFSNRSRPGRINKKVDTINLFPSNLQDGLVYRSKIPTKLVETVDQLPNKISKFLPLAVLGNSYTKWALETCQHIEGTILKKNNLVFLDINEVVTEYLAQVLQNRFHVLHKIFFNPKWRKEFIEAFPNEAMFYVPIMDGKYEKIENMTLFGNILKGKTKKIDLSNSKILIRELKEGRLCPALLTSFVALSFLNQFKCLGSFAQVEYLPVYQEKLAKLKFMKEFKIEKIPTANLTTGLFPEKENVYPADMIIKNKKLKQGGKILFGELLLNMKSVLLESYFIGDNRKHDKK
ncbi:hypothetical protein A2911_02330 [Candidatus Nomurabacteria bacterium RIFCSPLOWO2_01_FULL_40_15]|uniref:Uncharacterized protein n=1 Tax=Candidatus Nomurabacteria bacterium RIFCSPLOWO2_01_FULL_40_15 TaxID=1801772 RepID=A0A1F6X7W0_9BACT|nr:MAG: hypothetical protein A2911_02330 [Candidatus Nomurabacteria bacterium RIFCSPLOWO2_01_FULL_40_15]